MITDFVEHVEKLEPREGDILVLTVDDKDWGYGSRNDMLSLMKDMQEATKVPVFAINGNMSLTRLTEDQLERMGLQRIKK